MINNIGTQKIETERLILRKFEIDVADDMFNIHSPTNPKTGEGESPSVAILNAIKILNE